MTSLLHAIGKHIEVSKQTETAFGYAAVGDKRLVGNIRAGRELRPETEVRVWRYLDTHKPTPVHDRCACGAAKNVGAKTCHTCRERTHRYDPNGPAEPSRPTAAFKGDQCPLAKRINHIAATRAYEAGFDADPVIGWHLLEGHSPSAIRGRLREIAKGVGL